MTTPDSPEEHDDLAEGSDLEAQTENSAKRCAACDECHALRENVSPGSPSWEHIPVLRGPDELYAFPSLQTTDEQHIADPDGILAHYSFPSKVLCSLKGRHRHQTGLVVRSLCELVLCMGRHCGRKSIVGFQNIWLSADRRLQYQADCEYLSGWGRRFQARVDALERPLRAREVLAERVRLQLPEMWSELIGRASRGAAGREVIIPVKSTEADSEISPGKEKAQIRTLAGLEILAQARRPKIDDLRRGLRRFEEAERQRPPTDGASAIALRMVAKTADTRLTNAENWIRDTATFLSEDNLGLILYVMRRDNSSLQREDGGWRIRYMPGRSALLELPDVLNQARK